MAGTNMARLAQNASANLAKVAEGLAACDDDNTKATLIAALQEELRKLATGDSGGRLKVAARVAPSRDRRLRAGARRHRHRRRRRR